MTMITPSYLGETIEYSSLHACRSTLEDPTAADALALWAVHTYLLDSFGISPGLAITSPEKGCGKTTALSRIWCGDRYQPLTRVRLRSSALSNCNGRRC